MRAPNVRMTLPVVVIGTLAVLGGTLVSVAFLPAWGDRGAAAEAWRPRTDGEEEGRRLYLANGCVACHRQAAGAGEDPDREPAVEAADPAGDTPSLRGTARLGPDLAGEGGLRSTDWHLAHFRNPRSTRPDSVMPPFASLGPAAIEALVAYVQGLGGREADARVQRQADRAEQAIRAFRAGPFRNMEWLHDLVPGAWRGMAHPYPATAASLRRGETVYAHACVGCHGPEGDGQGPAAPFLEVKPFNLTVLRNQPGPIGGTIHHQVMNGIPGTAMTPFRAELESERIWDVANYVRVYFAGGEVLEPGAQGEF